LGGTALWIQARHGIDVEAWAGRALGHGVAFETARQFSCDGMGPAAARLGFTTLSEAELETAVVRMAAALTD
jgi:GntR family transcriptional regulator/MocR family aminotransferase